MDIRNEERDSRPATQGGLSSLPAAGGLHGLLEVNPQQTESRTEVLNLPNAATLQHNSFCCGDPHPSHKTFHCYLITATWLLL